MKVAADAELRELKLAGSEDLARADDRVVLRLVEAVGEVRVDAELAGEHLRVERRLFGPRVAGQPREIGERERVWLLVRLGLVRRLCTRWRRNASEEERSEERQREGSRRHFHPIEDRKERLKLALKEAKKSLKKGR